MNPKKMTVITLLMTATIAIYALKFDDGDQRQKSPSAAVISPCNHHSVNQTTDLPGRASGLCRTCQGGNFLAYKKGNCPTCKGSRQCNVCKGTGEHPRGDTCQHCWKR